VLFWLSPIGSSVTLAGNGQKRWQFQGFGENVVPKAEGYLGNVGEVWLLLGYAVVVLAGARLTEAVARTHFAGARRYAEHGFHYDGDADHYHGPHGERPALHVIDRDERVAVYRAPAASCASCPHKAICTRHDGGRHIYRPLAVWAETDVGRF